MTSGAVGSEMVHQFQSPSFSGIGFGNYVQSIEETEYRRQRQQEDDLKAKELELRRQLESSNLYKFLNNVEARIYAELSKQLVDDLFGDDPQASGSIELDGNKIDYTNNGTHVTLVVTAADGSTTTITLPIGAF